jgi:hypothetical protein
VRRSRRIHDQPVSDRNGDRASVRRSITGVQKPSARMTNSTGLSPSRPATPRQASRAAELLEVAVARREIQWSQTFHGGERTGVRLQLARLRVQCRDRRNQAERGGRSQQSGSGAPRPAVARSQAVNNRMVYGSAWNPPPASSRRTVVFSITRGSKTDRARRRGRPDHAISSTTLMQRRLAIHLAATPGRRLGDHHAHRT